MSEFDKFVVFWKKKYLHILRLNEVSGKTIDSYTYFNHNIIIIIIIIDAEFESI